LVYADWLQSVGHPQGDLIALAHAHLGVESREVLIAEGQILRRHWSRLLGDLSDPGGVDLTWRLGFIRSARVFDDGDHLRADNILQTLLHLDTALLIEHVTLERRDGQPALDAAIAALMASPPSLLHSVTLRPTRFPHRGNDLGDIRPLAALPRLDTLELNGPLEHHVASAFHERDWRLRSLTLRSEDPDEDEPDDPRLSRMIHLLLALPSLVELRVQHLSQLAHEELCGLYPHLRIECI